MADEAYHEPTTEVVPLTDGDSAAPGDTLMADAPSAADQPASSPAPAVQGSSPAPARTGTPAQGSRAASAHPDPGPSIPSEAPPHGDSTRRYLNSKVTGVLLEGMKQIAKDKCVKKSPPPPKDRTSTCMHG
ncbi:protein dpy-30 [Geosmithia morbida]|uniref:Protein dpy-30 n=1 Tax=Geosmithia morbida TaxID=1094350 RepID=A0A9P4YUS6_9HYPO|nr:protein dpy-30 [Geosmithia morbida]KAF4123488.1 protein dpy-30 [Geosmithia morbida]